ncbi:TonB-dependent receptor [Galbibacter sp. BG1]|uniref:SusC/RagA family TonB-linked outer membrane protein n=1 Tax=Galbibacter sp. BG1 TaxID=1170699 RepID=UPI0015BA8AAB|nr:TonB-dependent receptor [Galbibacter sp. BG1]QLE01266.1 TonB-dependent receptor [Galbibacter sp. BG1]
MNTLLLKKIFKQGQLPLFLLLFTCSSIAGNVRYSQSLDNTYLNLSLSEKTIVEVFKEIESQTDFTFVYSGEVAKVNERITINKQKISLKSALDFIAENASLKYMISGYNISVALKDKTAKRPQKDFQETVRGTVKDSQGPLPGVNVIIKGSNTGVVSDFEGNYVISASADDILVFSFLGFETQEVMVNQQTIIDVVLQENVNDLDEVVVVGYGTSTKKDLTTAVAQLKGKDIIEDKPFANAERALNGKVAGVQVIESSGSPGSGVSVRIRGANSLSASNDPLYVIDGVQVNNTEALNPYDIESISILKDASAASIYGARASNGVVLITTKRGEGNKSSISFSSYLGQDRIIKTLDVLNSEQYIDYVNTALVNAGQATITDPFNFQNNTDWQKELYAPATLQNYQLSFSGSSEKGNYYLSAGYQEEEGTVETTGFKRYSVRFNQDRQVFNKLKVGNSIALSRTNFNVINDNQRVNQGGVVLGALQTPPTLPIQNDDGTYPQNPYQALDNPIAIIRGESREYKTTKAIVNLYGEYEFDFGLSLRTSFGVDYNDSNFNRFTDPFTTGNGRATEGEAQSETFSETVWLWENTLNYKFEPIEDVAIDLLFGTSAQSSRFESTYLLGRGFANSSVTTADGASNPIDIGASVSEWTNNSYFLRTNLSFYGKYLISASVRRDGSSRFGPGNRYALFPSFSAAWIISEEDALKDIKWLSNLKIRYGYGVTGNQFIGNYDWYGIYGVNANYVLDENIVPGVFPQQVQNNNLKWESTNQHNLGLDLGFFKNRVGLTADFYHKETFDMLVLAQLPATTGFGGARQNIGTMINKGVELGLNLTPVSTEDFTWDITANYTKNTNEVTDLNGEILFGGFVNDQGNVAIIQEGEPVGNFYGWVAEGVDSQTGNVIFKDLDENGTINDDDRQIIGNALPEFNWGVTSVFNYKGLELTAFFQGVEGQDIYNATRFELENMATYKNQSIAVLDRWTPTNTDTTIPKAVFGDPDQNGRASTRWVEDGSFVKLRELTLGYTLPSSISEKLKMASIKIYAQGRNLYTWTDYSGYDPEVSRDGGSVISSNIDYGTYPQVKTYLAGINLKF